MSTLRAVTVLVLGVSFVACAERSEDGPTSPKLQVVSSGAKVSTPPMSVAEVAPSFAAAARPEPSRRRVAVIFSGPSKELGPGDENLLIGEGAQIVYRFRGLKAALVYSFCRSPLVGQELTHRSQGVAHHNSATVFVSRGHHACLSHPHFGLMHQRGQFPRVRMPTGVRRCCCSRLNVAGTTPRLR